MGDRATTGIARRLTGAIFLTSGIAVLASCLVLGVHHVSTYRSASSQSIRTLAETLSLGLADAMRFDDRDTALAILRSTHPASEILAAAVYDEEGRLFAVHSSAGDDDDVPARLDESLRLPDVTVFDETANQTIVYHPVAIAGKRWGTFVLYWSMDEFWSNLTRTLLIVVALLALVVGVAWRATQRLRRDVAHPISALAAAARGAITDEARRALSGRDDELEVLRGALAAWVKMREVVRAVEESTTTVSHGVETLGDASRGIRDEAREQSEAARAALESVQAIARSAVDVDEAVDRVTTRIEETTTAIHHLDGSGADIERQVEGLVRSVDSASGGSRDAAVALEGVSRNMGSLVKATNQMRLLSEQLATSVAVVEAKAVDTEQVSGGARRTADEGAEVVEQTRSVIEGVDASFDSLRESVDDLSARCANIAESLGVIESIADETNLLALNAAIIAAQSGEHGRPFAVVAESVRNLAVRTVSSAREIHDALEGLRESSQRATETVAGAGVEVREGVAHSKRASSALVDIISAAKTTAEHGAEITHATGRQQADLEAVRAAIDEVDRLAEDIGGALHDQERIGSSIAEAMEGVRNTSKEVGVLISRQKKETENISRAADDVSVAFTSIREETRSQARAGDAIDENLAHLLSKTESASQRADTLHELVEMLSEQTSRLRATVEIEPGESA